MAGLDVEDHLDPGEEHETTVEVGAARVYVTNRRVLVYDPEGIDERFHRVDRPNVKDAHVRTKSDRSHLINGGAALAVAALLAGASQYVETDGSLFGATGPGASALGVGGTISTIERWIGMIDDALLWGGVLVGLLVVFYAARYVLSRQRVVTIDVAGRDGVDIAADDLPAPRDRVRALREALGVPGGHGGPPGEGPGNGGTAGEGTGDEEKQPVWE